MSWWNIQSWFSRYNRQTDTVQHERAAEVYDDQPVGDEPEEPFPSEVEFRHQGMRPNDEPPHRDADYTND